MSSWFSHVWVSTLSFLQCFNTVGLSYKKGVWSIKKACATCPWCSVLEHLEKENQGGTTLPRFTWKPAICLQYVLLLLHHRFHAVSRHQAVVLCMFTYPAVLRSTVHSLKIFVGLLLCMLWDLALANILCHCIMEDYWQHVSEISCLFRYLNFIGSKKNGCGWSSLFNRSDLGPDFQKS